MLSEKELVNIKNKIDEIQTMKIKYEGKLEQLTKSLEDMGYKSVEEAKKDLNKMKKEYDELKEEIEVLEDKMQNILKDY